MKFLILLQFFMAMSLAMMAALGATPAATHGNPVIGKN
jgi:hypothetical protein